MTGVLGSSNTQPISTVPVTDAARGGYAGREESLRCGECGAKMELIEEDGEPLYVCSRFPACDGTHGAHPNGAPLGRPADASTRTWRKRCHDRFDRLWREHDYSRPEAYELLQAITGLSPEEAHISRFDATTCRRVIDRIDAIVDELGDQA